MPPMRVTSGFFVSALVRRVQQTGGFAAVLRRGAEEAGAVMIVARGRGDALALYRPAPQAHYDEAKPQERLFVRDEAANAEEAIATAIEREKRFDPDVWVVEIEPADGEVATYFSVRTP